jgi:acyl transferase domain-containing protein
MTMVRPSLNATSDCKYAQLIKRQTDVGTEMNSNPVAIVGMACHYPGAKELRHFWENILTRKRQFRRIPDGRLPLSDYFDPDPAAPDKTYCNQAALIDDFSFDLVQHRIPRSSYDSSDIVHWLALDVALRSLKDVDYTRETVPTERSGVILGNTLTGEHSRSEGLRLRWPFVSRALKTAAEAKGFSASQVAGLLKTTEEYYKSVFAPVTEDTLAGALSNTIAGRICNILDFHGGGYTVDGACSSSVIAIATAATALNNGDLDLALAGGVDVSLDTLELIGFAKTGAITRSDMRVYDRRADGFIPGEGCGFVVLKRMQDAVSDGDYVYATLNGWGISSDGKGGVTAPNAEGQARAIRRAYERADYDVRDLDFIEGHGTGTAVGDVAELESISLANRSHQGRFRHRCLYQVGAGR